MIDPSSSEEESDDEQTSKQGLHHTHHHHAKQSAIGGHGPSSAINTVIGGGGASGFSNAIGGGGHVSHSLSTALGNNVSGMHHHQNSSASDFGSTGGSAGGSSGHVTPQHLANQQHPHANAAMMHPSNAQGMGPDGNTMSSASSARELYQRSYQSASGSSAEYTSGPVSGSGTLDVPNKKMPRYTIFSSSNPLILMKFIN